MLCSQQTAEFHPGKAREERLPLEIVRLTSLSGTLSLTSNQRYANSDHETPDRVSYPIVRTRGGTDSTAGRGAYAAHN